MKKLFGILILLIFAITVNAQLLAPKGIWIGLKSYPPPPGSSKILLDSVLQYSTDGIRFYKGATQLIPYITASHLSDATTIGKAILKLTNPDAISFLQVNANNTASLLNASDFRAAIGAVTGTPWTAMGYYIGNGSAFDAAGAATNGTTAYGWGNWASNFGSTSGKITVGNDSRLSDARTPTSHTQAVSTISDATTIGQNFVKLTNPGAVRFVRMDVANTVTPRTAAEMRVDLNVPLASDTIPIETILNINLNTDSVASRAYARLVAGGGGSGTADSIRVLPTPPTTGNAYVSSNHGRLWIKSNNYWKSPVWAADSVIAAVPLIADTFEAGSATGWTTNQGTVNTYANFGIAAPTGGGTYGLQLATTLFERLVLASNYPEVWMVGNFRTGATASTRTQVGIFDNTNSNATIITPRFSSDASPKVQVYNSITPATYTGTTTFTASTWYKVKVRLVISATVGVVQVWVDAGAGYVLEINQTGVDTGSYNVKRVSVGNSGAGQTGYADNIGFYTSNPD